MPPQSIPYRPPSTTDDDTLLLDTIHPTHMPGEVGEARYISRYGELQRAFHTGTASLVQSAQHRKHGWNCYVGVALRDGKGGTADHCTRVGALYADADFKVWDGDPDVRAAALDTFRRFGLPLTAGVDTSNGFHVYLALAEPVDVRVPARRATFEAINATFARALCGPTRKPDAVHDVARILRVPGTLNHKSNPPKAVTLDWCDPSRRYSLAEVAAYLDAHYHWAMDTERPTRATQTLTTERATVGEGGRPGDDYSRRGDIRPLLRKHGWRYLYKRGAQEYWQRPGKSGRGTSATFNHGESGLLYVFTSDGAPFEPLTAYKPFAVYALLEHRGDYVAAAKALAADGYGDQKPADDQESDDASGDRFSRVPTPRHAADGGSAVPIPLPTVYEEALA